MNIDDGHSTRWTSAHHLALITKDLDATVRFYHGLLGMPLWSAMKPMLYHGRHCFFKAGAFFMHFFEKPDAEIAAPQSGWSERRFVTVSGAFQHVALSVQDEDALVELRERLLSAGVEATELMDQGPIRQFLFTDNTGILIEVNWDPAGITAMPVDYTSESRFDDPDPVPAVQELRREGR